MRRPTATVLAAVFFGLVFVGACSPADSLPSIDNPQQLLEETKPFLDGAHGGVIPPETLPPSLAALRPRQVIVTHGTLIVTCEVATGVGARGYVIDPDNSPIDPRLNPRSTVHAGLYRFEWQPQP
jgi:hypothetical protein